MTQRYDAIVLGTPVYWSHVCAQFKILVDRLYCFFDFDPETQRENPSAFPPGKKLVLVTSRADVEDTDVLPQFYEYMNEWLTQIADTLEPTSREFIHHYGSPTDKLASKTSASENAQLMAEAESVGAALF